MSVEAISWALNLAPVPVDSKGKPSSSCAFVLVALANHAGPDGTAAFPSVATLVRYTRLSERTVRTALDQLEAAGTIRPGDPAILAAHIKDRRYRPQVWDLMLALVRDDLTEDDLRSLERVYPGITRRVAAGQEGVQPLHPSPPGVQPAHLSEGSGVQPAQSRGATIAPEPYIEPSFKDEPSKDTTSCPEPASPGPDRQPTRLPADFRPDEVSVRRVLRQRPDVNVQAETRRFVTYWLAKPGKGGEKRDWQRAWVNWMSRARGSSPNAADPELHPLPPAANDPTRFEEFWDAYPLRQGRTGAEQAWNRALQRASAADVIEGARAYAEECDRNRTERRFIQAPANWLAGERWKDERQEEGPQYTQVQDVAPW